ncbi:hypothetical protein [Halomarina rubra]|uniref:Uncharacterized protein n=1 Tax=Halomarina rubra TaxID=2071873 RepID=A0ABD6AU51_9EURY|nr:hypothetical protein [Halomarina rubra]
MAIESMGLEATGRPSFTDRRSGALRDAVFNTVRAWERVEPGTVGGYPAFLVDDRPFAVVTDGGVALCGLDDDARDRLRVRWSGLTLDWDGDVALGGPTATDDDRRDGPGDRVDGPRDHALRSDGGRDRSWPLVPIGGNDLVLLRRFIRLSYEGVCAA